MAILYSYPQASPEITDLVLGSKFINGEGLVTKSFSISEIANLVQHIERPYEVYTALLTQTGASNILPGYGDEMFTIGVTYTIVANPDNYDLTIYGAPNNNVGTSFVSNQTTVLPYTTSLEFEYDTGAPVVTVLENTLGVNIAWAYTSTGNYAGTISSSTFTSNAYLTTPSTAVQTAANNINYKVVLRIDNSDVTNKTLVLTTLNCNSGNLVNSVLGKQPIEIRVYN
jgi:hypothetical protein